MNKPKWQIDIDQTTCREIRKKVNTHKSKIKALQDACPHVESEEDFDGLKITRRCKYCGKRV